MKKLKWLFGLCLMVLAVCGSGGSVKAYSSLHVTDDGIEYETYTDSDDVAITDYYGENETVIIPSEIDGKSVTGISGYFFRNKTIKKCIISEGIPEIGSDRQWLSRETTNLESVSLPSTLKTIGDGVFSNCCNLSSITLPDGLTSMGEGVFYNCSKLESIVLPDGLTSMGGSVFYNCSKLESIALPDGLYSIEERTFESCKNLETVSLPSTLNTIANKAFISCFKLNNINLSEELASIGDYAFWGCHSIERLVIPDSVTYIGEYAFGLSYDDRIPIFGNPDAYIKIYCDTIDPKIKFRCINHVHIVTDAEIPSSCNLYMYNGYTAGNRCADCGTILSGHEVIPPGHIYELKIIKEATVKTRGYKEYVCIKCGDMRREWIPKATVPKKNEIISDLKHDSYKVTKSGVKNGTVELAEVSKSTSSIIVPDAVTVDGVTYKVTSVSKNAFKNNKKLKKVIIGRNITKINANTFYGCKNLKTITIKSTNLKSVGKNAFKGINSKAKIKVPKNKLKSYKKLFANKGQKNTVKITK